MNIPNLLTLSRLFLTVVLWFLCDQANLLGSALAIVTFLIAVGTDVFDGLLARRFSQITIFGKIMDPIADKVLILTMMFIFASQQILVWWMVILIAVREILVTASRIYLLTEGQVIPAETAGKIKAVFQMITIAVVLVYRLLWFWTGTQDWMGNMDVHFSLAINVLMITTLVLTWWSGGMYFWALRGSAVSVKK
jgi:CDP-diacylglycerol--glycerol-3-phosphate 3-phosphatidyltransferase